MLDKIKKLETLARLLEPEADSRLHIREKIMQYTEHFLNNVNDFEALPTYELHEKGKPIYEQEIGEDPIDIDKAIEIIRKNVDREGINPASGGHLGYIPGGGIYTASLADYWVDITNRYAGVYFANPGAVRLENFLLDWTKKLVGYPTEAHGNLASGGSIANLIAIVAARDSHKLKGNDFSNQVLYMTNQVHHCVDKAIRIAGLAEVQVRYVDMDDQFKMDVGHLKTMIEQDQKLGLIPWLLIASAGTTDTGAIDPMEELGVIAKKHNMWFHVDAAYGGFFVLTEEGKQRLKGMELSDSMVLDPHKGMFLPYGLGIVLVRNKDDLNKSFSYTANYLQDAVKDQDEISPADVSPELTKHFRGLRMWLPLMIHGLKPFRACIEEKLLLAQYAYEKLNEIEGFETGPRPELSVVTFRYVPNTGDANEFNQSLIQEMHKEGRVFISSTTIRGIFILRFAILSFRTHKDTIDLAIKILKEKIALLEKK